MRILLRPDNFLVKQTEDIRSNNDVIEVEVVRVPRDEKKVKAKDHMLVGKFSGWKYDKFLIIKREEIIAKIIK